MTVPEQVACWTADGSGTVEIARLEGPADGPIQPPEHLLHKESRYGRTWILDDTAAKVRLYELCLTYGGPFDIYRCVNLDELIRHWHRLDLPDDVANTWLRALHDVGLIGDIMTAGPAASDESALE